MTPLERAISAARTTAHWMSGTDDERFEAMIRHALAAALVDDEATIEATIEAMTIGGCTQMRDPETGRCRYPDCQCDVREIAMGALAALRHILGDCDTLPPQPEGDP